MPTAPRTACSAPGCPNLQPCAAHKRAPFARRKTPKRQYGARHRVLTRLAIQRDRACVDCGTTLNLEGDHIDNRGPDELWNYQARCRHCNLRKAQREARAARLNPPGGGPAHRIRGLPRPPSHPSRCAYEISGET